MLKPIMLFFLLTFNCMSVAEEYLSNQDFLTDAFSGPPPKAKILWLTKDIKKTVTKILQHKAGFLRTRYWLKEGQSVWIINEVGKTKPITVGVVIKNKKISSIKVLAFRESRGWEVKHDFFTDQFKLLSQQDDLRLSKAIDGISGATLSVRALTKVAQLALFFDSQIQP